MKTIRMRYSSIDYFSLQMKDEDYLIQNNNMSTLTPNSVKRVQSMPASRHMVLSTKYAVIISFYCIQTFFFQ